MSKNLLTTSEQKREATLTTTLRRMASTSGPAHRQAVAKHSGQQQQHCCCGQFSCGSWRTSTKSATHKADIQLWLTKKGAPCWQDMVRAELLELLPKVNKPSFVYCTNTLAATDGHEVLYILPYHCRFNPVRLVCSYVKGHSQAKQRFHFGWTGKAPARGTGI